MLKLIEATEMWYRRMLRISWTARKTNDAVLKEANASRMLVTKMRKWQATFVGHALRRDKLENLVTTGKLDGKRSRGRQKEKSLDGLASWMRCGSVVEMFSSYRDRTLWRSIVAHAVQHGTQ
jgi:hypothetical protein